MLALKIGWRNLKRRRFRSILTGLMFFVGTYLLVFFVGLAEGTYAGMLTLGTRVWSGDFQMMSPDYKEKPALYKTMDLETLETLTDPGILETAPRIETFGLLARENKTIGVFLCGVIPDREIKVCGFASTMTEGVWWSTQFLEEGVMPIVVGKDVLQRLGAVLGDEISFVSQAADGSLAAELFNISGVLSTGIADLDREAVFIPLGTAQTMLALEGQVHKLIGITGNREHIQSLAATMNANFIRNKQKIQVFPWNEIMPELERTIKADRQGLYLFLIIIMVVVLLGVANTMMMSVMERGFELGLLQALGTSPLLLIRVILSEIFWLGCIGVGGGVVLGIITIMLFGDAGVPMGGYSFSYGGVIVDKMVPIITAKATLVFPLFILLSGLISGLIPALKASKTMPAKALGRTL